MKAALAFCATATLLIGCQNEAETPTAPLAGPAVRGLAWTAQGDNWVQD